MCGDATCVQSGFCNLPAVEVNIEHGHLMIHKSCMQECCAPTCFNVTCLPNYVKIKGNVATVAADTGLKGKHVLFEGQASLT